MISIRLKGISKDKTNLFHEESSVLVTARIDSECN